jgi:hypothetical protein
MAGTTQASIARLEAGRADATVERVLTLMRACGFDLDVRVVPRDDDSHALSKQSLALSPDQRLRHAETMFEIYEAGRRARGEEVALTFEPIEIVRTLLRHEVDFVVIGGFGSILHGAPHVTDDLDVVPDTAVGSLEGLVGALRELDARIRTPSDPGGVPFDFDAHSLRDVRIWNLVTRSGNLDLAFLPSGTTGYEDLRRDVIVIEVRGVPVPVASLADIIRSKEAAGRDRDRAVLPSLRRILAERGPAKEN